MRRAPADGPTRTSPRSRGTWSRAGSPRPAQLGIKGGSNGGLLMGVMLTRYPELFGAVVCQVPLLDMRRYHLLLAGASWMAEYGDPDDEADWAYLSQYSPYQNVRRGRAVPADARDDLHPRRPGAPRPRPQDGGAAARGRATTSATTRTSRAATAAAADNAQRAQMWAMVFEFLLRHLDPEPAHPAQAWLVPRPPALSGPWGARRSWSRGRRGSRRRSGVGGPVRLDRVGARRRPGAAPA